MTGWERYVKRWIACDQCFLCKTREHVVLARGSVPCDVLLIGEAPGKSEDVLGKPFVGPAGKLLDQIIKQALTGYKQGYRTPITYALTNLICCIPLDKDGSKTSEPAKESIDACADRLYEFIGLCSPSLIIAVGSLASKYLHTQHRFAIGTNSINPITIVSILHPAAILRMNVAQRGLAAQRCTVTIADAVEEL